MGWTIQNTFLKRQKKIKEKENISNLNLHLSDAMNIDKLFREDLFDKSYCYFSFQYFDKKKRELLLEKLSRITKRKGWIFLGDIPDKTRKWSFYESSGKFRIKRWGKNKIRAELRMKKIQDPLITKALDRIDEAAYRQTIAHLIKKKEKEVQRDKPENKKQKIFRFLLSKGFESSLILKNYG